MSELAVGSLKGLAANDFVIDVAAGSKLVQPGQILQVVSSSVATQTNTTSLTFVNTAGEVSITPSSTSSKILVFGYSGLFQINNTGGRITLARDTTAIGEFGNLFTGGTVIVPSFLQALDSPATTSAVTYRLRILTENVVGTCSAARHVMTAMEVAA